MKNTMKAIAALIISATMISITACGNTDNIISPSKGNHNGFKHRSFGNYHNGSHTDLSE